MDFSVIDAAGLSYAEAGKILGVSTVSVFKYKYRGARPRLQKSERIEVALKVLQNLVERGQLPSTKHPKGGKGEEERADRAALINKIVAFVDARVAG